MTYGIASIETMNELGPVLSQYLIVDDDCEHYMLDIVIDGALDESFAVDPAMSAEIAFALRDSIMAQVDLGGIDSFDVTVYDENDGMHLLQLAWERPVALNGELVITQRPRWRRLLTWLHYQLVQLHHDPALHAAPIDNDEDTLPFN